MCLTGPSQRVIADLEKPVMVPPEHVPAPQAGIEAIDKAPAALSGDKITA
jgi:hypothetical protein